MVTLLERVKKEQLPKRYQEYFEEKGGGAVFLSLNESSGFGLFGGGFLIVFFSIIILVTIGHTYQYPTYKNLLWLAFFSSMILLGIRTLYKAFRKKSLVDNFRWRYGLYFDSEAMLIATESYFTLVPRQSVYLTQKKDVDYNRHQYKGTIYHEIRYHGDWDFGNNMGSLSEVVTKRFNNWISTGETFSFIG